MVSPQATFGRDVEKLQNNHLIYSLVKTSPSSNQLGDLTREPCYSASFKVAMVVSNSTCLKGKCGDGVMLGSNSGITQ